MSNNAPVLLWLWLANNGCDGGVGSGRNEKGVTEELERGRNERGLTKS